MNTGILEKRSGAVESYRIPMRVAHLRAYKTAAYYVCPRCNSSIEREFMAYCDRCGQCLDWQHYKKAVIE